MRRPFAMLALFAPLLAPSLAAADDAARQAMIEGWRVECRADGACAAISLATAAAPIAAEFRIEQPAPGAPYEMILVTIAPQPTPDGAIFLSAIGRILADLGPPNDFGVDSHLARRPDDPAHFHRMETTHANDSVLMFLDLGEPLHVSLKTASGERLSLDFPMRGLTEALAWFERGRMD